MSLDDVAERPLTRARPTTSTLLAWCLVGLLMLIVILLFFVTVPLANKDALNLVIGAILGSLSTIVSFYFGDSKKSQQQAETISTLASKSPNGNS